VIDGGMSKEIKIGLAIFDKFRVIIRRPLHFSTIIRQSCNIALSIMLLEVAVQVALMLHVVDGQISVKCFTVLRLHEVLTSASTEGRCRLKVNLMDKI